jgi:tetratricopeptide (TPR) repeat protein
MNNEYKLLDIKTLTYHGLLRVFLAPMNNFIVNNLQHRLGEQWWEVGVLNCLNPIQTANLPEIRNPGVNFSDADKFDIGHLHILVNRNWDNVFCDVYPDPNIISDLSYIHQVRNDVSHPSPLDFDKAYQALDKCRKILSRIDSQASEQIQELLDGLDELKGIDKEFRLPSLDTPFIGRQKYLDQLHELLFGEQNYPTVAIVGEPGIGKRTLALAFARSINKSLVDSRVWCDVNNLDFQGVVTTLAGLLRHRIPDGIRNQTFAVWDSYISDISALVVIAGADTLYENRFRPVGRKCKTIITTTNMGLPRDEWKLPPESIINLSEFEDDESLEFLQVALNRQALHQKDKAAKNLVGKVGGLPLALDMAAKFLNTNEHVSIEQYVKDFSLSSVTVGKNRGVRPAIGVNYESAEEEDQKFFASLGVCTLGSFSEEVAASVGSSLVRDPIVSLSCLADLSLLRRVEAGRYAFHPLLREFARDKAQKLDILSAAEKRYHQWHMELVTKYSVYDEEVPISVQRRNKQILDKEIPGIQATAEGLLVDPGLDLFSWRQFWRRCRLIFESGGYFEWAIDLLEDALGIATRLSEEPEIPDRDGYKALEAYFAAQLGKFYIKNGQIDEAKEKLKEALGKEKDDERRKRILHNIQHADTKQKEGMDINEVRALLIPYLSPEDAGNARNRVYFLNLMGRAELVAGYPHNALEYFKQAIQIEEKDPQSESSLALTLSEYGRVLKKLKRFAEALSYFEKSLSIISNWNDQRIMSILNNEIGETLGILERYPEAMEHHIRSLELTRSVADSRSRIIVHRRMLKTLIPMVKKARKTKKDGKWNEALPLMVAWEQSDRALGEMKHAFWAMINRGDVLARLMRPDEALSVYNEARSIAKQNNDSHGISVSSQCRARVLENMSDFQSLQSALTEIEFAESVQRQPGLKDDDLSRLQTMKARIKWKLDRKKPKDQKDEYWEHIKQGKKLLELREIPRALQQFDHALVVAEMIGDLKLRSNAHQSRARLLGRMQDDEHRKEALHEWTKAELLEYQRETPDADDLSCLLVAKGSLLFKMGNRNLALRVAEAALAYTPDSPQAKDLISRRSSRKHNDRQLIVGCKGIVKKIITRPSEDKYFGFIRLDQPFNEKDVYFNLNNLECDWDQLHEGDSVSVDWFKLPDGKWSANRVIPTGEL